MGIGKRKNMIQYKKRRKYKYTLCATIQIETGITITTTIRTKYLTLYSSGLLQILAGYSWDGPSGPAIDTKTFMRASLVHDALYQLMREMLLPLSRRKDVDKLMYVMCREDGMLKPRAWWAYQGVRIGGKSSAIPNILTAP